MKTQSIDYRDGDVTLEGFYAVDDTSNNNKPAVLVVHDWSGKNEFACKKAEELAKLGYVGFAVDIFGKGKLGKTKEEKMALIQPFMQDRAKLQKRILAAFNAVKGLDFVDSNRIAAIGFCFGGLCALDLARSGTDVKAVVSFHGLLNPIDNFEIKTITAKVLALHGFDDPMVTPDQVMAFGNEMTHAKAEWELNIYGNTMHAFTNPQANDPEFGTVYNEPIAKRAWQAMEEFFKLTLS